MKLLSSSEVRDKGKLRTNQASDFIVTVAKLQRRLNAQPIPSVLLKGQDTGWEIYEW